jgi:asparagine synthase (glutamine-hydrolysing)
VARWFRGELRDFAREVLLYPGARSLGWCRREEVSRLLDEHSVASHDHTKRIWSLLMLELWLRDTFSDSRSKPLSYVAAS